MESQQPKKKVTVSLSGCGFLGIYHIGVVSCLREFEEHFEIEKFAGASAGAIAAACHLSNVCWGQATKDVLRTAAAARASPVGPLSPRFNLVKILRKGLMKLLPDNAHEICSGRLSISLTRCHDGANVMIDHFTSKEDLIQGLICTSFVPFYSGLIPPYFRDARYWDGGITNNLPIYSSETITVSPFSGESDICPADSSSAFMEMNFANHSIRLNSRNVYRLSRALFPPHPEILSEICEEGYSDAMRYVKKYLISQVGICPTPSAVALTSNLLTKLPENVSTEDNERQANNRAVVVHKESRAERAFHILEKYTVSNSSNLPHSVVEALREACESVQHPALRALAIVTIPWVLPLEFMYSTCIRIVELVPRPGTAELLYYAEFFSCVAQRVAVKMLNSHGNQEWSMKCGCMLESVKMSVSGNNSNCSVHGKTGRSHQLTFAFAMSIEETSCASILSDLNEDATVSSQQTGPEVHSGALELIVDDSATFLELLAVVESHDDEIVNYFQALIGAPQPPLILTVEPRITELPQDNVTLMQIDLS